MLDRNDPATVALLRAVTGQYSIEREVGRGGMGVVYLGVDEQLERPVAIKTLPPHLAIDPRVRGRFVLEARTAARLSHPNIVPIYAAAERDAVVYFAMRYINGESLAERITRLGPLPAGEVASLLKQLASALGYAHAKGVVHRDIKAENVLLDSETGRAMLTDFGIARLAESQSLTATGTVLGTVQYMSPEQVTGEALDGRSDLYSLGILAFFCLCGRFPFERPNASAIVVAHVTSMPPKLCSLANGTPAALGDIVDRLLAKSPADRYENGEALRAALDALPAESGVSLVAAIDSAYISRAPAKLMDMAPPQRSNFAAPPAPLAKNSDDVISSADAEQIWARAAQLQANTGMIVPPSFLLLGKSIPTDTVGFSASVVRSSGVDAGIDAQYVDRAMAERARATATSRASGSQSLPSSITETRTHKPNFFLGGRTRIELETAFDGELNDIGFEEIADEIRLALGEMVTVSAVGRTLTVTSAGGGGGRNSTQPRRVQIYVSSRNGRTTLRALEDLKQTAAGLFVGLSIGGGLGGGTAVMGAIMGATRNPAIAFPALLGTIAVGFGIARTLFVRMSRKREAELRDVLQRVIVRAQESLKDQGDNKQFPRR